MHFTEKSLYLAKLNHKAPFDKFIAAKSLFLTELKNTLGPRFNEHLFNRL